MTPFRFVHTSDLHLGRRFGSFPEDLRGRLAEARHDAIGRLATVARKAGTAHILIAGDVFDTETPSDPVLRQALSAMAEDAGLQWWLLPGNHDSLGAEMLWDRILSDAPGNVHPLTEAKPVELCTGVTLLPVPVTRRYPGIDLTDSLDSVSTPEGAIRIGLAHGSVVGFDEDAEGTIRPDRDRLARLDYLALGDWHGTKEVTPRTRYSGAPEYERFRHNGRGGCLVITLDGAGAVPKVERVEIGRYLWATLTLPLLPGQDAATALQACLPASGRRDTLLSLRAEGRVRLSDQAALREAAELVAPEFGYFSLSTDALETDFDAADLDAIDRGGALRHAAETLRAEAIDATLPEHDRRLATAALNRLYGYLRGGAA
jgi:DNA repair exonuclease SbcCD nuclease subunit